MPLVTRVDQYYPPIQTIESMNQEIIMSELTRWNPTGSKGLVPSGEARTYGRAMDRVRSEAQLAKLELDANAALAAKSMERAKDLDDYRKQLADGDPVLDQVLAQLELTAVQKMQHRLRDFGEPL